MRLKLEKFVLIIISATVLLIACPTWNEASDLSTDANIFMFPKPLPVSNMVLKNSLGKTVSLSDFRG